MTSLFCGPPRHAMTHKAPHPVSFRVLPDGSKQLVLSQSYYRQWEIEAADEIFHQQSRVAACSDSGDVLGFHTALTLHDVTTRLQSLLRQQWSPEAAEIARQRREEYRPLTIGEAHDRAMHALQLRQIRSKALLPEREHGARTEEHAARSALENSTFDTPDLYVHVTRKVSPVFRKVGGNSA